MIIRWKALIAALLSLGASFWVFALAERMANGTLFTVGALLFVIGFLGLIFHPTLASWKALATSLSILCVGVLLFYLGCDAFDMNGWVVGLGCLTFITGVFVGIFAPRWVRTIELTPAVEPAAPMTEYVKPLPRPPEDGCPYYRPGKQCAADYGDAGLVSCTCPPGRDFTACTVLEVKRKGVAALKGKLPFTVWR